MSIWNNEDFTGSNELEDDSYILTDNDVNEFKKKFNIPINDTIDKSKLPIVEGIMNEIKKSRYED